MNLMTIVIEYEGNEPPIKGFGVQVAGCNVVALGIGNYIQEALESAEKLKDIEFSKDIKCSSDPTNCENNEGFGCDCGCGHVSPPDHCTEDGCQKCWCNPKTEIVDGNLVVAHNKPN